MSAQIIQLPRYGALSSDWLHFDLLMGLGADLLPVVSNPTAEISAESSMQSLGKTPSRYNGQRKVVGIPKWTQYQAAESDIARWSREPDLGICIQTRTVRAIDVDVPDADQASLINDFITSALADVLPKRTRKNTGKFLFAFSIPGDMPKRVLKVSGGIIEFLATGQQFVACGTHPSGDRYEWPGGLPDEFPTLTLDQFKRLWFALDKEFSIEPAGESRLSANRAEKLNSAAHSDPVADHLFTHSLVRSQDREGRLHIVCPWESDHTTQSHDTSTTYWPAHTGGYVNGHFKCLHAHCADRTDGEFKTAIGFDDDSLSDFDDLGVSEVIDADDAPEAKEKPSRFALIPAFEFANRPAPKWIVKGIIPQADLVVLFGESGSGKSFTAIDMAGAVARGIDWQGHKVRKGRVVYIAAEGAGGCRNRLVAYARKEKIDLTDIDLFFIPNTPNLMDKAESVELCRSIGRADLVIVDTFAQATAGANENSGEDIGRALSHCKGIRRATGATVMLVHHAGKDLAKGARGWSGLRAAADAEIEVSRQDPVRMLRMSKQKDGEDGLTFYFDLIQTPIGMDDDGDVITSCVMNYDVSAPVAKQNGPKLNQWESLVMAAVTLIGESQSYGIERKSVVSDAVTTYKIAGGDSKNAKDMALRAVKTLSEKGFFEIDGDCINILNDKI